MEEKDRTELFMQEILDSIDSGIFKYYQEKKASGNPYSFHSSAEANILKLAISRNGYFFSS